MRPIDYGDLISRAEALETIKWLPVQLDAETVQRCLEAVSNLPSAQPEPTWIPCSERLPNHDECIKNNGLFNVSDGDRSYSEWFDYDKQKFGEHTMAGFRVDYAVTAWMPLPKPYEAEQ